MKYKKIEKYRIEEARHLLKDKEYRIHFEDKQAVIYKRCDDNSFIFEGNFYSKYTRYEYILAEYLNRNEY